MKPPRRIKCRFCDYSTPAFRVNKTGQRKSGYPLLRTHVEDKHPEEWERIMIAEMEYYMCPEDV